MEQKKIRKVRRSTDLETEPDYHVTLVCSECGTKEQVSGEWAEFNEIDNSNFVCINCQYLYD